MELKNYQQKVMNDLNSYLYWYTNSQSPDTAFKKYWVEKDPSLIEEKIVYSKNQNKIPRVCFKVPTGGGKTYIAAASLKPIFDTFSESKEKFVVWLVPSDEIRKQTLINLKNTKHPYHQRIARDFGEKIEVLSIKEALSGKNLSISSLNEQLTIIVMTYAAVRCKNKDDRKINQENGYFVNHPRTYAHKDKLVLSSDEYSLMNLINQQNPVLVIDESHHTDTELSEEMIDNFNPSFILDLTATPKSNSNIISIVTASELKSENMVKLPLILYNRYSKNDVIAGAIDLRNKLEIHALREEKKTGEYIRPIVLFQAEPKYSDDAKTYESLYDDLVKSGIDKKYIAVKTATRDDIENVDLLSSSCEIRYIITVNALNEGWDCPFAYVLATIANRNSEISVQQITGRILRQPYVRRCENPLLNMSYIITSSSDFNRAIQKVSEGLIEAGFTGDEYRKVTHSSSITNKPQTNLTYSADDSNNSNSYTDETEDNINPNDIKPNIDSIDWTEKRNETLNGNTQDINDLENEEDPFSKFTDEEREAAQQETKYNNEVNSNTNPPSQDSKGKEKMKYHINKEFLESVKDILLPRFYMRSNSFLGQSGEIEISRNILAEKFTLKDKDTKITFNIDTELEAFDVGNDQRTVRSGGKITHELTGTFKEIFTTGPDDEIFIAKSKLKDALNQNDLVSKAEIDGYVNRIVDNMTPDERSKVSEMLYKYKKAISDKIDALINEYCEEVFKNKLNTGDIFTKNSYKFPEYFSLEKIETSLPKSLYEAELNDLNSHEYDVIRQVSKLDNILWWHRNPKLKEGFSINGYFNHYPDFLIMTKGGKIIAIETKGDQYYGNIKTKERITLGRQWKTTAGVKDYNYFMVFGDVTNKDESVYNKNDFIALLKDIE